MDKHEPPDYRPLIFNVPAPDKCFLERLNHWQKRMEDEILWGLGVPKHILLGKDE